MKNIIIVITLLLFTGCDWWWDKDKDKSSTSNNQNNITVKENQKLFSYDSSGRITKEDLGNGQYLEYVYDDNGNLIQQNVKK